MFNKFCEKNLMSSTDFLPQTFYSHVIRLFPGGCLASWSQHGNIFNTNQGKRRQLGCDRYTKILVKNFPSIKQTPWTMIQNTLEESIMDKAIFTRGKGVHGECWQNGETSTQQKSTKIPQTVNTIESFLNQIPKASQLVSLSSSSTRVLQTKI